MVSTPYGLARREGTMVNYFGALVSIRANAATTDGSFSLIEVWAREEFGPPWHIHTDADEMMYVLEGELTSYVRDEDGNDDQLPIATGGMFYIPEGTPHTFKVTSGESRFLVMTYKPGFENWFVELGDPVTEYELPSQSVPSKEKIAAMQEIADRYHVELLGPPPE